MKNIDNSYVYKFFNSEEECIYVGITKSMSIRLAKHKQDKEWIEEVKRIEHSKHMNRNEAKIYEIYYISTLKPKYNIEHSLYVHGFAMTLPDLEFREFKDKIKRKRNNELKEMITERLWLDYNSKLVQDRYTLDKNKIDYLFKDIDIEDTKKYKVMGNVINDLKSRMLLDYDGCYNDYMPMYRIKALQSMGIADYSLLEHLNVIYINKDNVDMLRLYIVMTDPSKY